MTLQTLIDILLPKTNNQMRILAI